MGSINIFVMSFELANAPGTFISLMNKVFKPFLQSFVIVFIDDILIYIRNENDHMRHFRILLQVHTYNQLFVS